MIDITVPELIGSHISHPEKFNMLKDCDSQYLRNINIELNVMQKTYQRRYEEVVYLRGMITTILRLRGEYK